MTMSVGMSMRLVRAPSALLWIVSIVLVSTVLIAVGVARVSGHQDQIRVGYALSQARNEQGKQAERNRRLRLERSLLTNPARIEALARGLGMAPPQSNQIRMLAIPGLEVKGPRIP